MEYRPLCSLVGEKLSYLAPIDDERSQQIWGTVTAIVPEHDGSDARMTLEENDIVVTLELSWDTLSYGTFRRHPAEGLSVDIQITHLDVGPARFQAGPAAVTLEFSVCDRKEFKESFGVAPEDATAHEIDWLFEPFSVFPFGVGDRKVTLVPGRKKLLVTISANIEDPALFNAEISEAGRLSGRDDDWSPKDAAEALSEAFFGANDTGPSVDYGVEFIEARASQVAPEAALAD